MIFRLRNLLLSVAAASLLANGAHALTGPTAQHPMAGGVDPTSIKYLRTDGLVSAVAFQMGTPTQVRIRVSLADGWHTCEAQGTSVRCTIPPRPVTQVNRLEIQPV